MTDEMASFRRRIDECDKQIVRLINERLNVAQEVGQFKAARGMTIRIPEREKEVITKALGLNDGPCPPETLEKVFRILIDTAVSLEESLDSASPDQ
jgi:chorismate mutase